MASYFALSVLQAICRWSRGDAPRLLGASPLEKMKIRFEALKERNKWPRISHFQCFRLFVVGPGATRLACSALAPGYHISRLWRCALLNLTLTQDVPGFTLGRNYVPTELAVRRSLSLFSRSPFAAPERL